MKYIAFNLYRKNDKGGHTEALDLTNQPHGVQVCLVADLEDLAAKLEGEIAVAYNEYSNGQRAAYEHAARLLRELMVVE